MKTLLWLSVLMALVAGLAFARREIPKSEMDFRISQYPLKTREK